MAPGAVWQELVDVTRWPGWGPSVRSAALDHPGVMIRAGSTGRVHTLLGVPLPFEVTEYDEGHRWVWKVAGVTATGHRVEPGSTPNSCRAVIEVPAWAPAYAPLCWVALGRLGRQAANDHSS